LAIPLEPQTVKGETLREAFDGANFSSMLCDTHDPDGATRRESKLFSHETVNYFWEDHSAPGMDEMQVVERYDQPLSRTQWQFAPRREHMAIIDVKGGAV
jgi:CRISPR system Cascade subunit CasD